MASPVWIEGFEHGVLSVSGAGIVNSLTNAPTIDSSIRRTGNYSCRFYKTVAAACYFTKTISGSPTYLVERIYVYFTTLPSAQTPLLMFTPVAGQFLRLDYYSATQKLGVNFGALAPQYGPTITTGQWYQIDIRCYCGGATHTIDWAVDEVDQTQATYDQAASTFNGIRTGNTAVVTLDAYVDDIVVSATSGDYPLGAGGVVGLSPNAAGTSNPGTGVIQDNASVDINDSTNPANVELDDVPISTNTDYIKQVATGTGNYAEVGFADISESTIQGAQAFLSYMSSATAANEGGCIIRDSDGQETTVWGNPTTRADYSESSMFYKSAIIAVPSGGWTQAHVNALKSRIGYSNDISPVPYWENLMIQVAYAEGGATQKSANDTGSGADSVSVRAMTTLTDSGQGNDLMADLTANVAVADVGSGADLISLLARIALADTGSGVEMLVSLLVRIPLSDLGAAVDAVTRVILGSSKSVSDSGAGVDIVAALLAKVGLVDAGSGLDLLTIRALLSLADSGAGADIPTKTEGAVQKVVSDSGLGADIAAALARVALADSGLGADLVAAIAAHISIADLGAGADSVFRWIVGTAVLLDLLRPARRLVNVIESSRIVAVKPSERIMLTDRS